MTFQSPVCAEPRAEIIVEDALYRLGYSGSQQRRTVAQRFVEHHLVGTYLHGNTVSEYVMIDLTNELQTSVTLWRDDIAPDAVVRLQIRLGDAEGYIV